MQGEERMNERFFSLSITLELLEATQGHLLAKELTLIRGLQML